MGWNHQLGDKSPSKITIWKTMFWTHFFQTFCCPRQSQEWPLWAKKQFRKELQEMVDCLHNHPSVMVWIPFNEAWGQHDTLEIAEWLKSYDASRLLGFAYGDFLLFYHDGKSTLNHRLENMFTTKPSKVGKYRKWWKLFWSWRYCWSSQLSRSWFSTWRCTIWELHQGDRWIWWPWFGTSGGAFVANITEELGL